MRCGWSEPGCGWQRDGSELEALHRDRPVRPPLQSPGRKLNVTSPTAMHITSPALVALAGLALSSGTAAEVTFRSGAAPTALIELYTSEGCSSCPPAEKWLGELRNDPALWKNFVPVAFHVNYWDHLGWRDVLATKAFTEREHAYAEAWRASSVYTPCFVRNGQEWRPRDASRDEKRGMDVGTLSLIWRPETNTCQVEFTPVGSAAKPGKLEVSVALLGGGIVSNVRKGENAGRELRHEFVALRLETAALVRGADGAWTASVALPPRPEIVASRRAIAAWVSAKGQLAPIQAVGGWIE
jgi:hypothetical protein